ncbi:uncharacterized protein NEMAJ01_0364 [Nematocida major]|uniref:uncharacterized protein n=1 Tax=Nematocida major TaxID=1912982 RepID=UPI002008E71C|nr:uncharacterized protein NEMAJ01_0364 [Nematocida major]KAH9385468.1 hypothetical protein NEMAJ01_0364 [Nematocida major]
MNTRVLGVLALFACACMCIAPKDIDHVAAYIVTLQKAGYSTIFSLFDVGRGAKKQDLAKKHAQLIKACYISKTKKKEMPIGQGLSENEAKTIIVNGYQILTQPNLRAAYNWILDEAPPHFMENYTARAGRKGGAHVSMPSGFSLLLTFVLCFVVFDALRVCMPVGPGKGAEKTKKSGKKNKAQEPRKVIQLGDMYLCRAFRAVSGQLRNLRAPESQKPVATPEHIEK